jgi:multimeric flavodoxin WrbA
MTKRENMKILAIGGSPRKGNSEWMLTQLVEFLTERGADVDTLWLRKMEIKGCTGCLKCEDRKGRCQLNDAMNELYPRLIAADAIVMASPVYFEMISGLLKNFIDRTCPIWTNMKGKSLAGLLVAEEGIGQSVRNLRQYARVCKMEWAGAVTTLAKNRGEAEKQPLLKRRLKRLAGRIVELGQ